MPRAWGQSIAGIGLLIALGLAACAVPETGPAAPPESATYVLNWPESGRRIALSSAEMESWGAETLPSAYFDRVMAYRDSSFIAVGFDTILQRYDPGAADAVLLDCFDDYQGLMSLADVKRYRLKLATRIHLKPGTQAPGWLNPLLILVPDGASAPLAERFMTANIREVSFVNRRRYYAPLDAIAAAHPDTAPALQSYKDNCVFCHSLRTVGGNKGGPLTARFDFSRPEEHRRFENAFLAFHQNNPDKQNVAQFLDRQGLRDIGRFLQMAFFGVL